MSLYRTQTNTPVVYCNDSRDFLLFARLYDCVINGMLFDISSIPTLTDSWNCRENILPLLQTKLGFFTNKEITNDQLRFVLTAFPILVKAKGSLISIEQAVNNFLKLNNIQSSVSIEYVRADSYVDPRLRVPGDTVVISVNTGFLDISLLQEVFKYILPAGVNYIFYFYLKVELKEMFKTQSKAKLLITSHNTNSQLRQYRLPYSSGGIVNVAQANNTENAKIGVPGQSTTLGFKNLLFDQLFNAVDTINLASADSLVVTNYDTYKPGDISHYLGVYEADKTPLEIVDMLGITPSRYDVIIVNNISYIYDLPYSAESVEIPIPKGRIRGDVNGNGEIDYDSTPWEEGGRSDNIYILAHSVGLISLNEILEWCADVNKDGTIDFSDALSILRRAGGAYDEYENTDFYGNWLWNNSNHKWERLLNDIPISDSNYFYSTDSDFSFLVSVINNQYIISVENPPVEDTTINLITTPGSFIEMSYFGTITKEQLLENIYLIDDHEIVCVVDDITKPQDYTFYIYIAELDKFIKWKNYSAESESTNYQLYLAIMGDDINETY